LPEESPPFLVPDHTLIRRIGKGAYGEVWLARNALGTWRAVKFVRRSSFDDDKPFEREFAGIQRFEPISRSHESQLNILHVGRAEDGFYYVMELADDMGRHLGGTSSASPQLPADPQSGTRVTRPSDTLNSDTYTPRNLRSELHLHGRLSVAECLRIGLALTTALEHLHKHGLVHRDIKPSNIVFVNGIPKLADIGLVARAEATISFVGTEGFLPPEGPGTRQADIFSLGKVLYEISTGHDRQQFPELPTNIIELPDRAELSELNEVLLKACHRDPKERYQTAAEMHAELALLESGRSVVRMRGLERRLRLVQRAGAIVTILAGIIALGWWWQARQTRIVRDLASENSRLLSLEEAAHNQAVAAETAALTDRDRAQRSEQNTQRVLQFLLERVVAAARPQDDDGKGLGREVSVLQALQAAEPGIHGAFEGQPLAELHLRESLATTYNQLGIATNEAAHRRRALELSESLFGSGSPEVLTNRINLGWALRDAGLTNEYLSQLEAAWQAASNTLGAADDRTLFALGWLGVAYRELGHRADAFRLLENGVQSSRQAFGEQALPTLELMNHLAWTYHLTGQSERAAPLLEQVLTGRQRALGREHVETTRAMADLGRVYLAVGREREAFTLLEQAYEIRRQEQGPQSAATLLTIDVLARSYERAGRTNDALTWHTLALRLREAKLGPDQILFPGQGSTVRSRRDVLRLRAALGMPTNQPPY
jgi:tetratricopeptide (TPR) repeat protein